MIDWGRYENFSEAEFRCSCCGKADMDAGFLDKLQAIRTAYGKPMRINSGYRCPDYNDAVSGSGRDGPHTTGRAADIGLSGADAREIVGMAYRQGMTGIGVKQKGPHNSRFIHLDDLDPPHPRPTIWSY